MNLAKVGHWSFIIGVLLALLTSLMTQPLPSIPAILFVLGIIVGFLNVSEQESTRFLVGVIALLVIAAAAGVHLDFVQNDPIKPMFDNFVAFVAAAGLVVAIKQVLATGQADDSRSSI